MEILGQPNTQFRLADGSLRCGLLGGEEVVRSVSRDAGDPRRCRCPLRRRGLPRVTMSVPGGSSTAGQTVRDSWSSPGPSAGQMGNNIVGSDRELIKISKTGPLRKALLILDDRERRGVPTDCEVYAALLRGCVDTKSLSEGKQVHAHIIRSGVGMTMFLQNTLLNMYVKCGSVEDAREVFDAMLSRNVVSWNTMIAGYAKYQQGEKAFHLYEQMARAGVPPNRITFITILKALSSRDSLERGRLVHEMVVRSGLESDMGVANSLLEMYVRCENVVLACELFSKLSQPDEVSWNVLIAGYAREGQVDKAVETIEKMQQAAMKPKESTFVNVLCSCTGPSGLEQGMRIHSNLVKCGLHSDIVLSNCLIVMYAKCGSMEDAQRVFDSMIRRDVITWTSLIAGYTRNGQSRRAIEVFWQMERQCVKPTQVTLGTVLMACTDAMALEEGRRIHTRIIICGYDTDVYLMSTLVDMYAKCGSMEQARQVFDSIADYGLVAWNMMLAGYARHELIDEALQLFQQMGSGTVVPNAVTFASILNSCSSSSSLEQGMVIHDLIIKSGRKVDTFLENSLVNMYVHCGSLLKARDVFNSIAKKNNVSWSTMIGGYAKHGDPDQAFELFNEMKLQGESPDQVTFASILEACHSPAALQQCHLIHAEIESCRLEGLGDCLMDAYIKCGSLQDARRAFDRLRVRSVFSWTAMIGEYARRGLCSEAFSLFRSMILECVPPTQVTFVSILSACAGPMDLEEGRQIHRLITETGYDSDVVITNALLAMYARCDGIQKAQELFDNISVRDVITWNQIILENLRHGNMDKAHQQFGLMESEDVKPDRVTFCTLLTSCSSLAEGKELHSLLRERALLANVFVANCLLDMYVNCQSIGDARQVFDEMHEHTVVSWNIMIGGYVKQDEGDKALALFSDMLLKGAKPDKITFLCVLQACANPSALETGRKIHMDINREGLSSDIMLVTAVVDMYSKCGSLLDAREVFENMPKQDVVLWNAIIGGYSRQGEFQEALDLFNEMLEDGWKPDRWTFVSLFGSCTSPAALDNGKRLHILAMDMGFESDVIVASSAIHMYSKCGSIKDARHVFESIQDRDVVLWTTMIGVYAKHGDEQEALALFWQIDQDVTPPDRFLFIGMLHLCANTAAVQEGKRIHANVVRSGLQTDPAIGAALIDMYARCGCMDEAREVFNNIPSQDESSWTALVSGYTRLSQPPEIYKLRPRQEDSGA